MHRHFAFAIATLPLFHHPENVKISIFPFTLSDQKCCIFKSIWRIFKNYLLAERRGRWLLWLKISRAQIFWFWFFPSSWKCKKFNFSLYTVRAEMRNLEKYLTNFQKRSFGWKTRKVAIVVENFKVHRHFAFAIATLPLFHHPENVKISIFPFTLSQQKCYIFKSV